MVNLLANKTSFSEGMVMENLDEKQPGAFQINNEQELFMSISCKQSKKSLNNRLCPLVKCLNNNCQSLVKESNKYCSEKCINEELLRYKNDNFVTNNNYPINNFSDQNMYNFTDTPSKNQHNTNVNSKFGYMSDIKYNKDQFWPTEDSFFANVSKTSKKNDNFVNPNSTESFSFGNGMPRNHHRRVNSEYLIKICKRNGCGKATKYDEISGEFMRYCDWQCESLDRI